MCCASWSLSPDAFVRFILSLPAKSQLNGKNSDISKSLVRPEVGIYTHETINVHNIEILLQYWCKILTRLHDFFNKEVIVKKVVVG